MENKQKFIITRENIVAQELIKQGFTLLSEEIGKYVFLNNSTLVFNEDNKEYFDKLVYTNVLCF